MVENEPLYHRHKTGAKSFGTQDDVGFSHAVGSRLLRAAKVVVVGTQVFSCGPPDLPLRANSRCLDRLLRTSKLSTQPEHFPVVFFLARTAVPESAFLREATFGYFCLQVTLHCICHCSNCFQFAFFAGSEASANGLVAHAFPASALGAAYFSDSGGTRFVPYTIREVWAGAQMIMHTLSRPALHVPPSCGSRLIVFAGVPPLQTSLDRNSL